MMANPLLFWAWSAPGSFWAWRALVASFWPGVPWLIFGLECLGSFWRPGEPLVEIFQAWSASGLFWPGVPGFFLGLECPWLCSRQWGAHDSHTLLWHVGELGFAGDVWDPCLAETVILLYMKNAR